LSYAIFIRPPSPNLLFGKNISDSCNLNCKKVRTFATDNQNNTTMETSVRLYTLNYDQLKTYLWAAVFVVCNMALPQIFHLIPQGGIIFAPLSLVILAGAYKLGWKTGLLAAVASPIVNNLAFGMPAWGVLQVMMVKLVVLALIAGFTAQHFRRLSLPLLLGVVLASEVLGGLGELLLTGGFSATVQDFTLGWPGLLLQVVGGYFLIKHLANK